MKRAALALLGILAGCMTVNVPTVIPAMLTESQISTMKGAVLATLKDPESARFGRFLAGKAPGGTIMVCGWINARNSFGGYTGEQPFSGEFQGNSFALASLGGDDLVQMSVLQVCAKAGLSI